MVSWFKISYHDICDTLCIFAPLANMARGYAMDYGTNVAWIKTYFWGEGGITSESSLHLKQ